MLCNIYELIPITDNDLCKVLCFPMNDNDCCEKKLIELKDLGIDKVFNFGKTCLWGKIQVVGKGHAAIVVLAHHVDYDLVALKIRRTDSKRFSMEWEAQMLSNVVGTGYAPKLYSFSRNFLVRDYIDGCTLEELVSSYRFERRYFLEALKSLLMAALAMDLAGVDLAEVSRPINQVVYLCCDPSKPFFIDFESAKISSKPLNVTKIISFVVRGFVSSTSVKDIIGLDNSAIQELLNLAKEYKLNSDAMRRRSIVGKVLEVLGDSC